MASVLDQLFIFEMANNHQGSMAHGKAIIDAMAEITKRHKINGGIKFQFRDLDTFIHPQWKDRTDIKHINRFQGTRLSRNDFAELVSHAKQQGILAIATPFDEASVQQCVDFDIDVIKIASCSALDWPLLEAVAQAGKPVVVSSGGVALADIDKIVNYFKHRKVEFALLHCVGIYPTPNERLNMKMVSRLQRRYPEVPIGYSGHEAPDNLYPVIVATSLGAQVLERHVGVETADSGLNAYSMNPAQTDAWVQAALTTNVAGGRIDKEVTDEEKTSLQSLMRGVYIKRPITSGQVITRDDVYFAMPLQDGQVTSGDFGSYRTTWVASRDYNPDESLHEEPQRDAVLPARDVIHQAQGMLSEAGITLGEEFEMELSHHYGMERFREIGATIVNLINREYCKKLVIILPGQSHPKHRHEKKEETFELLYGDLTLQLDDRTMTLKPGDRVLVERGVWHSFTTHEGAIFEEISTTHYRNDSFYEDKAISSLDPMQRKTIIRETV